MKVIAKTGGGFLCDVSADELANLCSYSSAWRMRNVLNPRMNENEQFRPGDEIDVSKLFQTLYTLTDKADAVRKAQAELRSAANALDLPLPTLDLLQEEVRENKARE